MPKVLKSCPKSNKSPNLVTLPETQERERELLFRIIADRTQKIEFAHGNRSQWSNISLSKLHRFCRSSFTFFTCGTNLLWQSEKKSLQASDRKARVELKIWNVVKRMVSFKLTLLRVAKLEKIDAIIKLKPAITEQLMGRFTLPCVASLKIILFKWGRISWFFSPVE